MSDFRGTEHHPEGTMPMTYADDISWSLQTYERCLSNMDILNARIAQAYSSIQRDPTNLKYVSRYHGLCLLRDVDNGETGE